jgi:hypothetical protein
MTRMRDTRYQPLSASIGCAGERRETGSAGPSSHNNRSPSDPHVCLTVCGSAGGASPVRGSDDRIPLAGGEAALAQGAEAQAELRAPASATGS